MPWFDVTAQLAKSLRPLKNNHSATMPIVPIAVKNCARCTRQATLVIVAPALVARPCAFGPRGSRRLLSNCDRGDGDQ
jgi:hypothetical protein